MTVEFEEQLIADVKKYVQENLPLSKLTDEELQEKIEGVVAQRLAGIYCSIEQKVSIVQQVYSSIRGFGLLDSIISDDTITEVMINGPENIFIEQNGRLFKLDKQFESQRKLEDIIQRIVGLAGREVNQANSLSVLDSSEVTINDISTYRFKGLLNCALDISNRDNSYDAYAFGYSFIMDGIPCSIIGSIINQEQAQTDIDEITAIVDAMIKTLRSER